MWNDGACGENCPIGSILFNDFTCSDDVVSGKTPIGVVVYKDGKGAGQALALNSVNNGAKVVWSTENVDISTLPSLSQSQASQDFASCENSKKIMAAGNKSKYPAVWAAYNYTTTGTKVGDWCLPAAGIFTSYYNNQSVINTGFSRAGGTKFTTSTYAWSSSEYSSYLAWYSYFNLSYGLSYTNKDLSREVRPVVGFCDDAENYVYDQATDSCVKDSACRLGSIFYSDKTCSMKLKDGKTPIGIVVYIDGTGGGQALALKSIGKYEWGPTSNDISTLPNYSSNSAASKDYDSCGNTAKIIAAGNKSKYPAAWAAHEYKTAGTEAGDWCLPAAGIFTSYYNNQDAINSGFTKAGGTKFTTGTYAWLSSEYSSNYAWRSYFYREYGLNNGNKNISYEVRPVIEF